MLSSSSSASVDLVCVHPDEIERAWPHASAWVKSAFDTGLGDSTFESTRGLLFGGHALLWLIVDRGGVVGAVVTQIVQEPAKKLCTVLALGGTGMARWKHLMTKIEKYAAHERCAAVRIYGRSGWQRVYPEYTQPWIALERKL